jgi:hypothetical protein
MKSNRTIILLLLALTSWLPAQGFYNTFGQYQFNHSTRSLGLGGAGVAVNHGAEAIFTNPAFLAAGNYAFDSYLGVGLFRGEEERSIVVYDNFDGYLTDEIYALQNNVYYRGNAAVAYGLPLGNSINNISFGLGYHRVWDFNYEYEEQLRNPDPNNSPDRDKLYGYNRMESTGALHSIDLAAGINLYEDFYFGVGAGLLHGTIERIKQVQALEDNDPPFVDSLLFDQRFELDNLPVNIVFGGAWRVNERTTLALRYTLPGDVEFKNGGAFEQPQTYALGLMYRARNILRATVFAEAEIIEWSQTNAAIDNGDGLQGFRDVWHFRLGIEHKFHEQYPFRLGFNFQQLPYAENLSTFQVTFGSGMVTGPFAFDLSGAFGSNSYNQTDLFPNTLNGADAEQSDPDQVKEINIQLMASVKYAF